MSLRLAAPRLTPLVLCRSPQKMLMLTEAKVKTAYPESEPNLVILVCVIIPHFWHRVIMFR
jgi:hypothetical protein